MTLGGRPRPLSRQLTPRSQSKQEFLTRKAKDAIAPEAFPSSIEKVSPALRVIFGKAFQTPKVLGSDLSAILHFNRTKASAAVQNEINLRLGPSLPVMQRRVAPGVVAPSP